MQTLQSLPQVTVGLDIGDRKSAVCRLNAVGKVAQQEMISTTPAGLCAWFRDLPGSRVILEASTHSPWVSRLLTELGHEVIVANPAALRRRTHLKTDRVDAEALARWGRIDPSVLAPIQHRGAQAQADLELVKARDALVRSRTLLINHVRGSVKSFGLRISGCSSSSFASQAERQIPAALRPAVAPLLEMIAALTQQIRACDRHVEQISEERYPETNRLRQVAGVGPLTSLCYALVIEDPNRFPDSRSVGAYLGLVPRKDDSSEYEPELPITKAGNVFCRRLLVQSAQYILGPFGPDTDLRRWGLALAARGGKNAKKRAVIAVARKLSVLLLRLWRTGDRYQPLYHTNRVAA